MRIRKEHFCCNYCHVQFAKKWRLLLRESEKERRQREIEWERDLSARDCHGREVMEIRIFWNADRIRRRRYGKKCRMRPFHRELSRHRMQSVEAQRRDLMVAVISYNFLITGAEGFSPCAGRLWKPAHLASPDEFCLRGSPIRWIFASYIRIYIYTWYPCISTRNDGVTFVRFRRLDVHATLGSLVAYYPVSFGPCNSYYRINHRTWMMELHYVCCLPWCCECKVKSGLLSLSLSKD